MLFSPKELGMVYLASPYSSPDREIQAMRFRKVLSATAMLVREGYIVFSPIVHSHPLHVREGVPNDWTLFRRIDFAFIDRMDTLVVLQLEGWNTSIGVVEEICHAREQYKRVVYMKHDALQNSITLSAGVIQ